MNTQLYCPDETRKARIRDNGTINGIDYLEVLDHDAPSGSPPQQTLLVHCFLPAPSLTARNVRIDGGVRITPIGVLWAYPAGGVPGGLLAPAEQTYLGNLPQPVRDRLLVVRTDRPGDFSTYRLCLVLSPTQPDEPPAGFDRLLAAVDFSFKVDCPSDFDCRVQQVCPQPILTEPRIDYLAKDYASFRQLMLDRLAVIAPDWQERHPADLGMALVEVLAYAGDHLSYYQDAVATEAYLGTARRRVSVRRHARLVDYFLSDGVTARAWICLNAGAGTDADGGTLPAGTPIVSGDLDSPPTLAPANLPDTGITVFETLHPITMRFRRNAMAFYTWGDPHCCLPRGATAATLAGSAAELALHQGDVLLFEEVLGPESGQEVDANPATRHAVRLDSVPIERTDPLTGTTVLDIHWHADDALPFPFSLREFPDGAGGVRGASVARGNVVLADCGRTIGPEPLSPPAVPADGPYRPHLQRTELAHAMPYDDGNARSTPAAAAMTVDLRQAVPSVTLRGDGDTWHPQRDLLQSDRFSPDFVVEMEDDGTAFLRFGDGVLGHAPGAGGRLTATYRVGNGVEGNVGPESLRRAVIGMDGIIGVRNPLPASGGADPEPIDGVRLNAPQAFRTQERAVTEVDYAEVAGRHPEVQRAAATRRWTGSWYTQFVTVDRKGGAPVDDAFKARLRAFLESFRLAGYDLEIEAPHFVPLDIFLTVCVQPGYFGSDVKEALLAAFSNRDLPDGRRGFFHPDNFTFGQTVYLSRVVATAMEVAGVAWVDTVGAPPAASRFQRWGRLANGELAAGRITFAPLEIARLDNDPNAAENGKIDFLMKGGL